MSQPTEATPRRNILFLDDCPYRTEWAKEEFDVTGNYFASAATAQEAIGWLEWAEPEGLFTEVYLDHDLSGETYVDSSRKDCGFEVVRWIVANRPTIGGIVVHSMNTPAGNLMVNELRWAGYIAHYVPFLKLIELPTAGGVR